MTKRTTLFHLSALLIVYLTLFLVLLIAVCATAALHSYIRSQNWIVRHENDDISKFEQTKQSEKATIPLIKMLLKIQVLEFGTL